MDKIKTMNQDKILTRRQLIAMLKESFRDELIALKNRSQILKQLEAVER